MKIRFGFISNSSSTSFICRACGTENSGWDWEDDPICSKCGSHIYRLTMDFSDYLIIKYNLNKEEEMEAYIIAQNGRA